PPAFGPRLPSTTLFRSIVAGDLNLPSPSPLLRRSLGFLQDGFAAAGRGFGYTFPTKRPFLRLDRVMVSEDLRVTRFGVGCGRVRSEEHTSALQSREKLV